MKELKLKKLNYMLDRVVKAEKYELACSIRDTIIEIQAGKWKKKRKKKKNGILHTNDIEEVLAELQDSNFNYSGIETEDWIWEYLEFEKVIRISKKDGLVLTERGESFRLGYDHSKIHHTTKMTPNDRYAQTEKKAA